MGTDELEETGINGGSRVLWKEKEMIFRVITPCVEKDFDKGIVVSFILREERRSLCRCIL